DLTEIGLLTHDGSWLELQVGRYDPSNEYEFMWGDSPYPRISLQGLKNQPYSKVQNISIRHSGVRRLSELEGLSSCKNLEYLGISGNNPITEFDVTVLRGCNHMKAFDLSDSGVDTFEFSIVQDWPELYDFSFNRNQVQTIDLTPFAYHPSLRSVSLCGNPSVEIDISPLLTCQKLRRITLHGGYAVRGPLKNVIVPNPPPQPINPLLAIFIPSGVGCNGHPDHYHRKRGGRTDMVTHAT
ncbi:MAG: hypothetical protein ACFFFG_17825, partial [Candidatus Thorarchaeota archaeon]